MIMLYSCFTRCKSAQFCSRSGQSTDQSTLLTSAAEVAVAERRATDFQLPAANFLVLSAIAGLPNVQTCQFTSG